MKVTNEDEVKRNWEQLKLKEGKKSLLEGVPNSLPAMVKAEVIQVEGLSVHADVDEVCNWLKTTKSKPAHTFVVHGEPASSSAMAEKINSELGWPTTIPRLNQRFYL